MTVDGESTDGSGEFLRSLAQTHGFRFISARMNRGREGQLAFRESQGESVITLIDTDDLAISLQEARKLYHEVLEKDPVSGMQHAFACWGFFTGPRLILEEIGEWPDLHSYENQQAAYRLAIRGG